MARQVSQIDVADVHNAAVILSGDPAVIYVGDDQFLQRLQSYAQLAPALRQRVPDIARATFVSQSTVRNQLGTIYRKLGVHSQTELLALLRGQQGQTV